MTSGLEQTEASIELSTDLLSLASERSSEKRVELLRRITDTYVTRPVQDRTNSERVLLEEVVTQLLARVSGAQKAQASETLSRLPGIPKPVAEGLALDHDIAIARPMIQGCRELSEHTLVRIAQNASQDHLHAIASRPRITPPVTDVVVSRGDKGVIRTLAANSGAQFSDRGMARLIDKAANDSTLQSLIVERADLSTAAVARLLPMISDELAGRLRGTAVEVNQAVVEAHFAEWIKEQAKNNARIEAYIAGVKKGDLQLNNVFMETLRSKRLLDAAMIVAAMLNFDRSEAFNMLTGGKTETVLLLFKAAGLAWPCTEGFLKLRSEKTGVGRHEPQPRASDYEIMEQATAQRVIRFMNVRRTAGLASAG